MGDKGGGKSWHWTLCLLALNTLARDEFLALCLGAWAPEEFSESAGQVKTSFLVFAIAYNTSKMLPVLAVPFRSHEGQDQRAQASTGGHVQTRGIASRPLETTHGMSGV